jgi:hypothetical protein
MDNDREKREVNAETIEIYRHCSQGGSLHRIEGSKMTDDEVLINNLDISKLEERDQQQVAGYFEPLELIAESYRDIDITENNLKHLHNILLKHSKKDG